MNLSRFPRRRYTEVRTPIEKLERLTTELGGPALYIKRDDLLGLAGGGNKTRKLEFLVADAIAKGADTLVTGGAVQSNHCRLTLAAAAKEGMRCFLVLEERVPGSYRDDASGNNFLFRLMGVERRQGRPRRLQHARGAGSGGRGSAVQRPQALRDSRRRLESDRRHGLRRLRSRDPVSDRRSRDSGSIGSSAGAEARGPTPGW